ncbi:uncharacterized protein KY384_005996 [Bacidia gigantensis]|uniref:uncharacterized protein n=1 Tax=Bacidia gigantensis TaxID=2732470 RepID=UPI001D058589|nr:uncharacterized protein KY384_005996 [Bacidia gigantensis]KAG8529360.1 hypothetical protein KY384_005996 [Bacidia gigantensis]
MADTASAGGEIPRVEGDVEVIAASTSITLDEPICCAASSQHLLREVIRTGFGVLDLKSSPRGTDMFAVAGSNGNLVFYFIQNINGVYLREFCSIDLCRGSVIITYLDWVSTVGEKDKIAMACSDGTLGVVHFDARDPSSCSSTSFVSIHIQQAWYVAWDGFDEQRLYSGGDDAHFCTFEDPLIVLPRTNQGRGPSDEAIADFQPSVRDKRTHTYGVTAIVPIGKGTDGESIVLTGSYDNRLRILRRRKAVLSWQTIAETDLGGGVWRISFLEHLTNIQEALSTGVSFNIRLVASCMQDGPKIVEVGFEGDSNWSIRTLARVPGHQLNYATIAMPHQTDHGPRTLVSTDFTNRQAHVWRF